MHCREASPAEPWGALLLVCEGHFEVLITAQQLLLPKLSTSLGN